MNVVLNATPEPDSAQQTRLNPVRDALLRELRLKIGLLVEGVSFDPDDLKHFHWAPHAGIHLPFGNVSRASAGRGKRPDGASP